MIIQVPPAKLRSRVSMSNHLKEYLIIGSRSAHSLDNILAQSGYELASFQRILDFACGCGRTLNFVRQQVSPDRLHGCDYDSELVAWCQTNLAIGSCFVNAESPPTEFPDSYFDFLYSISFFTHITESKQRVWLSEWRRIVKNDGLVLLTLLGEKAAKQESVNLPQSGFSHVVRGIKFNENTTYQSQEYVQREWTSLFDILDYQESGLNNHQDVVLLGAPASKNRRRNISPPVFPSELMEAYQRRKDLRGVFDEHGMGRPDSDTVWKNLTLLDWALSNGGYELTSLKHLSFDSFFQVVE